MENLSSLSSPTTLVLPKRGLLRCKASFNLTELEDALPTVEPLPSKALTSGNSSFVLKFFLDGSHPYLGAPDRKIGQAVRQRVEIFAQNYNRKIVYYPKSFDSRIAAIQRVYKEK